MNKTTFVSALLLTLSVYSVNALAVEVGQSAPTFTLPSLKQDKTVNLQDFAGKVVYVDFWASWCAPCRVSFPEMNKLYDTLKAKGFEVIAINLDEDKANADKFLQEIPVNFTVLRDASGEWADRFVVESMPTSFIVDKKGVVQFIHHGFTTADVPEITSKINSLLGTK